MKRIKIKKKQKKLLIIFGILFILFLIIMTIFLINLNKRNTYPERNYCTWASRLADVCITIYQPVCGYPLEKTYSNSCSACIDKDVEYYISGEC